VTGTNRIARRAVAAAGVAWIAVLFLTYRKPGARPADSRGDVADTLVAEAGAVQDRMRFRDFDYVETRGDEGRFRLRAAEALRFEENWERKFRLKDVEFEATPEGSTHPVRLFAPRAEFVERSKAFRVFDGVEIVGEESTLRGPSFRYEPAGRTLVSEGAVSAERGRLVIKADAGTVRTNDGVVLLGGGVELRGRGEDGRPLRLSSPKLELSRGGQILAEGEGTVLRSEEFVIRSRTLERRKEGDGDRVRSSGSATLVVAPSPRGLPAATLVSGDLLELQRDAFGQPAWVEASSAGGKAQIDVAPSPRLPARRARSPRFTGRFRDARLAEIDVPAALEAWEAALPGGPPGSGLKTLEAGGGRFVFTPAGKLDVASFREGVRMADGVRASMRGTEATLRGADDTAVLSGTAEAPAEYRDERGSLTAATLSYARRDDRIDASGHVRASWSGEGRGGLLGNRDDGPLHSESETLRLSDGRSKLRLTGNVRAWQKESVLRSELLELDDANRTLRAERNVRVFLRREAAPRGAVPAAAGKGAPPGETINATGDLLTHREADRLIRIEGHANLVSGSWEVTSDVADFHLTPDRAVEYAEARGTVALEDRSQRRKGNGTKATFRPQAEVVTLEGSPAVAFDGKGNRTTGAVLTFRQGRSQVDVETGGVASETTLRPEGS
jgi:lipopolysaccharide export system protein LptA